MSTLVAVDPIEDFFAELGKRGHVPLLDHVSGTVEFDIEGTDRRWVTVNRGDLVVTRSAVKADCVVSSDAQTFTRIIAGQQNAVAAAIRGGLKITGNVALGLSLQRISEPQ